MNVNWRIGLSLQDKETIKKLRSLGPHVRCEVIGALVIVNVYEDDPAYNAVIRICDNLEQPDRKVFQMCEKQYSEEERSKAKWLHVYSTYFGIDNGFGEWRRFYKNIHATGRYVTAFGEKTSVKEYEHKIQIAPLQSNTPPKWRSTRQFCTDKYSGFVLLCSEVARQTIKDSELNGATFCPVLSAKTGEEYANVLQLMPAMCEDFLAPGPFIKTWTCNTCGKTLYRHMVTGRGELLIREEQIPKNLDFVQTPPIVSGCPYYVISQRAYHILKDAQITRSLVFEPLGGTGDGSSFRV